jgi:hypothetical protein
LPCLVLSSAGLFTSRHFSHLEFTPPHDPTGRDPTQLNPTRSDSTRLDPTRSDSIRHCTEPSVPIWRFHLFSLAFRSLSFLSSFFLSLFVCLLVSLFVYFFVCFSLSL